MACAQADDVDGPGGGTPILEQGRRLSTPAQQRVIHTRLAVTEQCVREAEAEAQRADDGDGARAQSGRRCYERQRLPGERQRRARTPPALHREGVKHDVSAGEDE